MFFKKKPKQYIPQTEVGQNIMKIREILIKIEEMKRNQREEMKQKKIELIKIDTNGVLQEQSFKPSEGLGRRIYNNQHTPTPLCKNCSKDGQDF